MGVTSLKNLLYGKRSVCDIGEKEENMEANCILILAMKNG